MRHGIVARVTKPSPVVEATRGAPLLEVGPMGHAIALPNWLLAFLALVAALGIYLFIRDKVRAEQRRQRRLRRSRRHIAKKRSWDWLMNRSRDRRLTYRNQKESGTEDTDRTAP